MDRGSGGGGGSRRGTTYLEVQVAFAVLGVALAGLSPIVVSQLRMTSRVEELLPPHREHEPAVNYIVPAGDLGPGADDWFRKLGAVAELSTAPPIPSEDPAPARPKNRVLIERAGADGPDDVCSAEVRVEPLTDPEEPGGPGGGPDSEPEGEP